MLLSLFALVLTPQTAGLPPPAANPTHSAPAPNKLPPARPLPLAGEEGAVLATLERGFAALAARDFPALQGLFQPGGLITEVTQKPGGTSIESVRTADFLATLAQSSGRIDERISDPAVEIDGDVAMVWTPYVVRIDGKVDHCGTDHYTLVRVSGAWRILNITGTTRSTGCPA